MEQTLDYRYSEEITLGYPPALAKACHDEFDYAMRLRTGELLRFGAAKAVNREWVTIIFDVGTFCPSGHNLFGQPWPLPRGVDIRVDSIAWVADAPEGS